MLERDQVFGQIDRLTGSSVLHGSESLCKLLKYLGKHAVDEPGVPLKEYQIATEVFGRPSDFDPQTDSTIRVQAGRLRTKLSEYYASEGVTDRIVVELPRGTYIPAFHDRQASNGNSRSQVLEETNVTPDPSRRWMVASIAACILLIIALAEIANLLQLRSSGTLTTSATESVARSFQLLWGPFVDGPQEPWVIFSNAAFVGRPESGIRYFDPARDSGSHVFDHYTGVGEVIAIHNLDQVFALLHRQIRVKRGSLFSLDDARNNDLIFVGSPSENLTLQDIPGTQEFVFQRITTGPRKGDLAVVNEHPQGGEPIQVLSTVSTLPLTEDYAVIAYMPGLNRARSVMILAGITTIGTQAGVEYVCREDSVKELLGRLGVLKVDDMKPFEALLRVKVARGVPVETTLVAVRKRADKR
jgi:hypothetical protein